VTATEVLPVHEAGVYDGIPPEQYHANPALSASGAKLLLPPSCPALYKWQRDHPPESKPAFDFGHAAHGVVLGCGDPVTIVEADNWLTKAAKEAKAAAYADGRVPVLAREWEQVQGMAAAIRSHPIAAALFDPGHGQPEQSAYWEDTFHGVWRRARFDWLPDTDGGRLILPDYKTTTSAEPGAFARSVFNFGYDLQASWYIDAAHALTLAEDVAFVFVAQEKTAPYLVTVFELDVEALAIGHRKTQRALSVFAECQATDTWPAYSSDVELISPPAWLSRQYEGAPL
jgi:hypothetical protein